MTTSTWPRAIIVHPRPDQAQLDSLLTVCSHVTVLAPGRTDASPGTDPARVRWEPCARTADMVEEARKIHREQPLDLAIPLWEGSVETTAKIADALGLPGNRPAAAHAARDKLLAASLYRCAGVPHPRTVELYNEHASMSCAERLLDYPFIVKIPRGTNSQSVRLVRHREELLAALSDLERLYKDDTANRLSDLYGTDAAAGRFMAQEYIVGPELNVDLLYDENEFRVLGIFEKYPMHGPTFGEVQSVYPAAIQGRKRSEVIEVAGAAVRALGATVGAAHVELRLSASGPQIIESGLRPGGFLTPQAIQGITGLDPLAELARCLTGRGLPHAIAADSGHACLYGAVNVDRPGRVVAISGAEKVVEIPGVKFFKIVKSPGDRLLPLPLGTDYHVAVFLLEGEVRSELEAAADRIRETLVVEVRP